MVGVAENELIEPADCVKLFNVKGPAEKPEVNNDFVAAIVEVPAKEPNEIPPVEVLFMVKFPAKLVAFA